MKTERSTEISALFDGELEAHEVRPAILATLDDPDRWRMYALIGDGLRGESIPAADMTASVMARIGEEPVVLAPRNLKARQRHHPLLALAASVAGVAVVGWVALTGNPRSPAAEPALAAAQNSRLELVGAVSPAPTFSASPLKARALANAGAAQDAGNPPPQTALQGDMSEYLVAHHAQTLTGRLGDSTIQIRTVAMTPAQP